MASLRVSKAVPGLFRAARPTVVRSQLSRQIARRTYASGGHGPAKSSGDVVWAATSIAVTVPTLWYLLKNGPDTSHGHDDHGDTHGTKHEEEDSEEKSEEKSDEGEDKADDKESEKSEESESDSEDKGADTPDTSDDEGEGEAEDTSDDNTRKSVPDAKGGSKAKLQSNKSIKQGEGDPQDEGATSGPAGSQNTQSGKQEGLSNTDTKHSTDITNNPDKSSKGEGVPETAKTKGAVDPNRPQP